MGSTVISGGFRFSLQSVGGAWSWCVSENPTISSTQVYFVKDILSPFGKLIDVSVPIPADVIQSMNESILSFQQQLSPSILVQGALPDYYLTVVEAGPNQDGLPIQFTNIGNYGSIMSVSASSDVPWLKAVPSVVSGISKNQSGQVIPTIYPASLLYTGSPYTGHLNLQDNHNPPNITTINYHISVLPRPSIQVSTSTISLTYSLSTFASGGSQVLLVTNNGPASSILNFQVAKVQATNWFTYSPTAAGPLTSGQSSSITFSINTSGIPSFAGTYLSTIQVISTEASNSPIVVNLVLNLTP